VAMVGKAVVAKSLEAGCWLGTVGTALVQGAIVAMAGVGAVMIVAESIMAVAVEADIYIYTAIGGTAPAPGAKTLPPTPKVSRRAAGMLAAAVGAIAAGSVGGIGAARGHTAVVAESVMAGAAESVGDATIGSTAAGAKTLPPTSTTVGRAAGTLLAAVVLTIVAGSVTGTVVVIVHTAVVSKSAIAGAAENVAMLAAKGGTALVRGAGVSLAAVAEFLTVAESILSIIVKGGPVVVARWVGSAVATRVRIMAVFGGNV
jgi:hypothetical protein